MEENKIGRNLWCAAGVAEVGTKAVPKTRLPGDYRKEAMTTTTRKLQQADTRPQHPCSELIHHRGKLHVKHWTADWDNKYRIPHCFFPPVCIVPLLELHEILRFLVHNFDITFQDLLHMQLFAHVSLRRVGRPACD